MKTNWIHSRIKAVKDSPWQTIPKLQLEMQMVANSTTFSWSLEKKNVPETVVT